MNDFTIARTADTAVKIGDSFAATNQVGIEVNAIPQLPAGTKVRVTVTVGCGAKEADLLASRDELVKVTGQSAGKRRSIAFGAKPTSRQESVEYRGFPDRPAGFDLTARLRVQHAAGRRRNRSPR
jgi:hypothetical protein